MKQLKALFLALLFVSSTALADLNTVHKADGQQVLNVSYIQMSHFITLTPIDLKSGMYTMTIKDVSPFVTYYSDRPTRVVGQISVGNFLNKWNNGANSYSTDAPNAILSGGCKLASEKHRPVNVVMELLTSAFNKQDHVLTYKVHVIKGLENPSNQLVLIHNSTLIVD